MESAVGVISGANGEADLCIFVCR